MKPEAATKLLTDLTDSKLMIGYQDVKKLLEQLTFLPLAILQAAQYINVNGISVSKYISLLEDTERDVIEILSEDFDDERRYKDVQNPLATTWLIFFNRIHPANLLPPTTWLSCRAWIQRKSQSRFFLRQSLSNNIPLRLGPLSNLGGSQLFRSQVTSRYHFCVR